MKARILSFLTLALSIGSAPAFGAGEVEYHFSWEQPETKLELKMFLAPITMRARVGEQGEYLEKKNLPVLRMLEGNRLKLAPGEQAVLYLVAKNPGKKKVKFFVAPHGTEPAAAGLGFNFRCLCYNHVYTVEPGRLWYRVMLLSGTGETGTSSVRLHHILVRKP